MKAQIVESFVIDGDFRIEHDSNIGTVSICGHEDNQKIHFNNVKEFETFINECHLIKNALKGKIWER